MKVKSKIFIAVEGIRTICPKSKLYAVWCRGCRQETELVTFAEAAKIVCKNVDKVVEQTACGKVHLGIRPDSLLVCLNSLLRINKLAV